LAISTSYQTEISAIMVVYEAVNFGARKRMTMTEEIIIQPRRGKREQAIPARGLMLVTPAELKYGRKALEDSGGRGQFMYSSSLTVSAGDDLFVAGPAIGAPVAAMTMEKLIVLGARRVVMFGWCGVIARDLQVGDVVVGGVPVSGEGTSRYYPSESAVLPAPALVTGIRKELDEAGISFSERNVWSTDAPYREDRKYIEKLYDNADVCCVDMEYSALCAVAAFRGIEFAALFLVSDELYREQWLPGYVRPDFREKSMRLVRLLLNGEVFRVR